MTHKLRGFLGHHKAATTWIRRIASEVCALTGRKMAVYDNPGQFDNDLPRAISEKGIDFIAFTNADMEYARALSGFKAFHVIRDPRDILVSSYFSHRHSHPTDGWPELVPHRVRLQDLSEEEGLLCEMEFSASTFRHLDTWDYAQDNVLELRFEDVISAPEEHLVSAFSFLDLVNHDVITIPTRARLALNGASRFANTRSRGLVPVGFCLDRIPAAKLENLVRGARFARLAGGREPGKEDRQSHYRKGVPGDWKNHFDEQVKDIFKRKYGHIVIKLGYEADEDW